MSCTGYRPPSTVSVYSSYLSCTGRHPEPNSICHSLPMDLHLFFLHGWSYIAWIVCIVFLFTEIRHKHIKKYLHQSAMTIHRPPPIGHALSIHLHLSIMHCPSTSSHRLCTVDPPLSNGHALSVHFHLLTMHCPSASARRLCTVHPAPHIGHALSIRLYRSIMHCPSNSTNRPCIAHRTPPIDHALPIHLRL